MANESKVADMDPAELRRQVAAALVLVEQVNKAFQRLADEFQVLAPIVDRMAADVRGMQMKRPPGRFKIRFGKDKKNER